VAATGKHFIGHSLSQGGLNCGPVHLGSQELFDVYLTPFQSAIREAGLAAIMNAYPEIDGEVVAASSRILTDLLRGRLGFQGLVVSDYQAVAMIHNFHSAAADFAQAAAMAIQAGIDVELPTADCYGDPLRRALEAGEVSLEVIDRAVLRHLSLKQDLGLFDHPYVREEGVAEVFETPADRELARRIARQSMVLLKNDGVLPLSKTGKTLAVIGPNAASERHLLGDYAYIACVELLALWSPENSSFVNIDVVGRGCGRRSGRPYPRRRKGWAREPRSCMPKVVRFGRTTEPGSRRRWKLPGKLTPWSWCSASGRASRRNARQARRATAPTCDCRRSRRSWRKPSWPLENR
jgi:beta-glucosidase